VARRYIIRCVVCGELGAVSRSDAVCCTSRCRVRLKRHPELLDYLRLLDVLPTFSVKLAAYIALFPERVAAIWDGRMNVEHPTRKDLLSEEANADVWQRVSEIANGTAS
jgi:hypothetical protein